MGRADDEHKRKSETGGSGNFCGVRYGLGKGTLTTLHSFELPAGGAHPSGGLVQNTDGDLYGTTYGVKLGVGGASTVYALSEGLGPFVEAVPGGEVGSSVTILGSKLQGATVSHSTACRPH